MIKGIDLPGVVSKCNDVYSWSTLRQAEIFCIKHMIVNVITKVIQHLANDFEGIPFIVIHEIGHILQEHNLRFVMLD